MKSDSDKLRLIVKYCDYIESDISRFGNDIETFIGDLSYQRSSAKSLELIGETAKKLSSEFTTKYDDVDWHEICRMRDFMSHQYEFVDLDVQWTTMTMDVPALKNRCLKILDELNADSTD